MSDETAIGGADVRFRPTAWTLVRARHPLLDARLSLLRQRALGETRAAKEAVPLDLDLAPQTRLLVVSSPASNGVALSSRYS